MLLSRSGQYALRALLHIAEQPEGPVRTSEIAAALDVPANYLSKLLHRLARDGVLDSTRGPSGGFALAIPADQLSLAEALQPIESERLDRRCLLGRPQCRDSDPCAVHGQWKALAEHIDGFLGETTLANLLPPRAPARSGGSPESRKPRRTR